MAMAYCMHGWNEKKIERDKRTLLGACDDRARELAFQIFNGKNVLFIYWFPSVVASAASCMWCHKYYLMLLSERRGAQKIHSHRFLFSARCRRTHHTFCGWHSHLLLWYFGLHPPPSVAVSCVCLVPVWRNYCFAIDIHCRDKLHGEWCIGCRYEESKSIHVFDDGFSAQLLVSVVRTVWLRLH